MDRDNDVWSRWRRRRRRLVGICLRRKHPMVLGQECRRATGVQAGFLIDEISGRYGPPPRAKYLCAGIHAQWRATSVSLWRLADVRVHTANDQMALQIGRLEKSLSDRRILGIAFILAMPSSEGRI